MDLPRWQQFRWVLELNASFTCVPVTFLFNWALRSFLVILRVFWDGCTLQMSQETISLLSLHSRDHSQLVLFVAVLEERLKAAWFKLFTPHMKRPRPGELQGCRQMTGDPPGWWQIS